jgi:hypothetical protein
MEAQKIDLNNKLNALCRAYMTSLVGVHGLPQQPCTKFFAAIYIRREKAIKHRAAHFKDLTYQPLVHNDQID